MLRRLTALCAVVVVTAAACSSPSQTPPTSTPSSTPAETSAPTSTATSGTEPVGTGGVDPAVAEALRAEVAELATITEEIRGLRFLEEPTVTFLTEAQLAARVREDFESNLEPGEVEWTEAWLDVLGLLDPEEQPLLDLYNGLLGEQVIGLYVSETNELLVRGDAAELSVLSRVTIVHELIHALTDQHFDVGDRLDALVEEDRFDEATAYISLLEGEATYFQFVFITEQLTTAESLALATEVREADSSVLDGTPYAIAESLFFRYEEGLDFALGLAARGGVEAFNDAHRQPPLTSEHIAHPARFFEEEPAEVVTLPSVALAGYEVVEESTWGELGLLTTFGQAIGEGAAAQIGDGWGGDAYRLLTNGTDIVFMLSFVGDTETDAVEVAEAFVTLATESMDTGDPLVGDDGSVTAAGKDFAYIDSSGKAVVFVAASDPVLGAEVAAALSLP